MNLFRHSILSRRSGFTLIEVMVAAVILGIVLVGLLQVLSLSLQTWQMGLVRTNSFAKARVVLNAVTADIQRGVFRPDLQNFITPTPTPAPPNNTPTFTFYTRAAGVSAGTGTVRPISLVTYQLSPNANSQGYLLRSESTVTWTGTTSTILNFMQPLTAVSAATPPSSTPPVLPPPPNDLLSKGVVDFEMIFLMADGSTVLAKYYKTPTAFPVVMIGVAVAVIDDREMTVLQATGSSAFTSIQTALETALTTPPSPFPSSSFPTMSSTAPYTSAGTQRSIKEVWDQTLAPIYLQAGYPKNLATGLQTFERFVPCTPFN